MKNIARWISLKMLKFGNTLMLLNAVLIKQQLGMLMYALYCFPLYCYFCTIPFLKKISIGICFNEIIILVHGHVFISMKSKASYTNLFFFLSFTKNNSHPIFCYVSHHFRTLYWISNRNGQYSIDGGSFDGMKRWKIAEKAIIQNPSGLFYDHSYKKYEQILV